MTLWSKKKDGSKKKLVFSLNSGLASTDSKVYNKMNEKEASDAKPFDIFSPWTRIFVEITEILKTGEVKSAYFKMTIAELQLLLRRLDAKMTNGSHSKSAPVKAELSISQVAFKSGKFAGKTPKQVLDEGVGTAEELFKNAEWLYTNHQNQPGRIALLNAILSALFVVSSTNKQEAKENASQSTSQGAETLHDGRFRSMSETNDAGKTKFYDATVVFDSAMNLPVKVSAENYWAPKIIRPDGTQSPKISEKETISTVFFNLTVEQLWSTLNWINTIISGIVITQSTRAQKCASEISIAKKQESDAEKADETEEYYDDYSEEDIPELPC